MPDMITFYTPSEVANAMPGPITRNLHRMVADFRVWNTAQARARKAYDCRMAFICPDTTIEHEVRCT